MQVVWQSTGVSERCQGWFLRQILWICRQSLPFHLPFWPAHIDSLWLDVFRWLEIRIISVEWTHSVDDLPTSDEPKPSWRIFSSARLSSWPFPFSTIIFLYRLENQKFFAFFPFSTNAFYPTRRKFSLSVSVSLGLLVTWWRKIGWFENSRHFKWYKPNFQIITQKTILTLQRSSSQSFKT